MGLTPPQHTHTHTHQLLKLTQPVSACPASLSHSYLTRAPSVHVLSAALSWVTTVLHPISSTTQSTPCFLSIPLQGSSLTNIRTREGFRIRLLWLPHIIDKVTETQRGRVMCPCQPARLENWTQNQASWMQTVFFPPQPRLLREALLLEAKLEALASENPYFHWTHPLCPVLKKKKNEDWWIFAHPTIPEGKLERTRTPL